MSTYQKISYLYSFIYEPSSFIIRSQMWIFLCTGASYIPNFRPTLIELLVYWKYPSMVGCDCVMG